jgi:hypothetical protein
MNMEERVDARSDLRFARREIVQKLTEFHGLGAGVVVERVKNYSAKSSLSGTKVHYRATSVIGECNARMDIYGLYAAFARYRRFTFMRSCILA